MMRGNESIEAPPTFCQVSGPTLPPPLARGYGSPPLSACGRSLLQVPGCNIDLRMMKLYYQKTRLCHNHIKALVLVVDHDGPPQRFCQQCCKLHPTIEFDGDKR